MLAWSPTDLISCYLIVPKGGRRTSEVRDSPEKQMLEGVEVVDSHQLKESRGQKKRREET